MFFFLPTQWNIKSNNEARPRTDIFGPEPIAHRGIKDNEFLQRYYFCLVVKTECVGWLENNNFL